MSERPMRVAYALCVSAGIVTLAGGVLPWAQTLAPARTFGALELGYAGMLVTVLLAGVTLAALGVARTPWAALVAFGNGMVTVLVALDVHGSVAGRIASLGVTLGPEVAHPYGYGFSVLFAGAALSVVAAVALAIQVGPPASLE